MLSVRVRLLRGGLFSLCLGLWFGVCADLTPSAWAREAWGWLPADDIQATFGGRVIDGHYRDKRSFSERYAADGSLEYTEPFRRSAGRWSVRGGSFCTIYDQDPTGGCFRVKRTSSNCFEFYFVARSPGEAAAKPQDAVRDWTARGWLKEKPSTCGEDAVAGGDPILAQNLVV
ncbi:MAG: hypothetical protein AAFV45_11265 [Pseudomonadota bacterium]